MKLHRTVISLIIAVIVLLLISQSVAVVNEGQTGVRMRFGSVVAADLAPGLHFKLPFLDQVLGLDANWIVLNGLNENGGVVKFNTQDGKALEADYVATWRISDAAAFCAATACDESTAARRINDSLKTLLDRAFAAHSMNAALADTPAQILQGVPQAATAELKSLGVQVETVRLTTLTLPHDALDAVYARMSAAELARAAEIRTQGLTTANQTRADADRRKADILAQASSQTQKIRGEAEVAAAAIYQRDWQEDPAFFRFYRSLEIYQNVIKDNNSVVVLGPDSPLLRYLDGFQPAGGKH